MKIMHTDNFGRDDPDEKFVEGLPLMTEEHAQKIADAINAGLGQLYSRFYRPVPNDYKLLPGFEP